MNKPYTLSNWLVKPGREEEFIIAWRNFARWAGTSTAGGYKGYLLRDDKNPLQFASMGTWENMASLEAFRQSAEFKSLTESLMELCQDFTSQNLSLTASS